MSNMFPFCILHLFVRPFSDEPSIPYHGPSSNEPLDSTICQELAALLDSPDEDAHHAVPVSLLDVAECLPDFAAAVLKSPVDSLSILRS